MKPVPLSRLLSLAGRQLFRESRSGELRVLFFALLIAVASSTAIGYFSARLNGAMLARAAEFLAPTWCSTVPSRQAPNRSNAAPVWACATPTASSFPA